MRTFILTLALALLISHSQAHGSESAKVLSSIKQMEEAYKEGSAEKMLEIITSMKGMDQEGLEIKAKDDAKLHKGFVSKQVYSEENVKIDRDLAIAFCDDQSSGTLFLRRIEMKWKIIIDWSLPSPVGTTYSQEAVERMRELHRWRKGKEKSIKPDAGDGK